MLQRQNNSEPREAARPDEQVGKSCSVLLADDHAMVRDGLRRLLESEPGIEVIGEAASSEEAMTKVRELAPDILLLDLAMPTAGGLHVLETLSSKTNGPGIILLTASITAEETVRAMRLGARGIVLKGATAEMLIEAIHAVRKGQYWIHPMRMGDLIDALKGPGPATADGQRNYFGLTPRERDIVGMVVDGYSNPDIARKCSISEQTVKHHISNIFDKLGVYNRVELALFAVNHDLVPRSS